MILKVKKWNEKKQIPTHICQICDIMVTLYFFWLHSVLVTLRVRTPENVAVTSPMSRNGIE